MPPNIHHHDQIAAYPFTTLNPHLGAVDFPDFWRMTVADIPGIVPNAHNNVGLGLSFLRHIERSRVLLFIVDMRFACTAWACCVGCFNGFLLTYNSILLSALFYLYFQT